MKAICLLLTSFLVGQSMAQDSLKTDTLSLYEVMELVKEYHPIVRQANLQKGFAEAELRTAKGALDPKVGGSYQQKKLKGTQYYDKFNAALKVPVWFPIDPKVEIYQNEGQYLNPENYVSGSTDHWQVTTGVSLPLGKGLFIDERRSMIRQARLYGKLAEAEQIKETNKILLTVIKSYWEWYYAYRNFRLMDRSMTIAQELFERTKMDFDFGEAAAVDTVQAKITWQNRKVDFEKAKLEKTQTVLGLSVHLWGPDDIPVELAESVVPQYLENFGLIPADSSISKLITWAQENHPDIRKLETKKQQLEIEKKWNQESLKPEVNLSYSLIDAPIDYQDVQSPNWTDSYKFGVDVYFPLYLRKERGKLEKTRLYIESTEYTIAQIRQEVVASIKGHFAELKTNQELSRQYQDMAENYNRLLQAEIFNMKSGESDLFKLNIQQDKYLESQRKYFEADLKFLKLKATLPYVVGLPYLDYQALYE